MTCQLFLDCGSFKHGELVVQALLDLFDPVYGSLELSLMLLTLFKEFVHDVCGQLCLSLS